MERVQYTDSLEAHMRNPNLHFALVAANSQWQHFSDPAGEACESEKLAYLEALIDLISDMFEIDRSGDTGTILKRAIIGDADPRRAVKIIRVIHNFYMDA